MERAEAVQVDPTYILIAGETGSPDFPLADPFQTTLRGGQDAFVSLLSPNLDSLYYSTFVGGTQFEVFRAAIVTSQGRAVLAGNSQSADWPTLAPLSQFPTKLCSCCFPQPSP